MAVINCPECGKEISDTNKKCPHCGFKLPKIKGNKNNKNNSKEKKIIIIIVLLIIIAIVGGIFGFLETVKLNSAELKKVSALNERINECSQISFDGLKREEIEEKLNELDKVEQEYSKLNWREKYNVKNHKIIDEKTDEAQNEIEKIINQQVNKIEKSIDDLGEITKDSGEVIKQIESDYEQLDKDCKKRVSNYEKFKKARSKYNELAVEEAILKISKIGKIELTDKCGKEISNARAYYDELEDSCKEYVTNIDVLKQKEKEYKKLTGQRDSLLKAKEAIDSGNLYEAKRELSKVSEKFKYKDVSVKSLKNKLDNYPEWVKICGKWENTKGKTETGCKSKDLDYTANSWVGEIDKGSCSIEIRCIINKDNTITIKGSVSFLTFTDYSTIQAGLEDELKTVTFEKKIDSSAFGTKIEISDNTTLTINKDSITSNYYLYSTNEDTHFNYTYKSDVTYGNKIRNY